LELFFFLGKGENRIAQQQNSTAKSRESAKERERTIVPQTQALYTLHTFFTTSKEEDKKTQKKNEKMKFSFFLKI